MTDDRTSALQVFSDEIINEALVATDYTKIFEFFCNGLSDLGLSVFRVHMSMSTLHPLAEGISLTWRPATGVVFDAHEHGSRDRNGWQSSPLHELVIRRETSIRLGPGEVRDSSSRYPVIAELLEEGLTDYLGLIFAFSDPETAFERMDGLVASFCSASPEGFSEEELAIIHRLMPRFSLIAKLANRERLFSNVLDAYFGENAGSNVRSGQIALGSGQYIDAVIWFCDLRKSTPLSIELGSEAFIDLLNDYFRALAGAVMENGGEILRFVGDAALAVFPIDTDKSNRLDARQRAALAAELAVRRAAEINAERKSAGKHPFEFGIGIHAGEIMFGNIGVPTRVEFSVIGPNANEAARIESMCKVLEEKVLVSAAFLEGKSLPHNDLGLHDLRGIGPRRLFALQLSD